MQIQLNGDLMDVADDTTVLTLLQRLDMTQGRLAVEVNADIIPRSQHGSTRLQAGDRVEIVQAIGGG